MAIAYYDNSLLGSCLLWQLPAMAVYNYGNDLLAVAYYGSCLLWQLPTMAVAYYGSCRLR